MKEIRVLKLQKVIIKIFFWEIVYEIVYCKKGYKKDNIKMEKLVIFMVMIY